MVQPTSTISKNAQIAATNRVCMMSFKAYEAAIQELEKIAKKFVEDLKVIKWVQEETTRKIRFCALLLII